MKNKEIKLIPIKIVKIAKPTVPELDGTSATSVCHADIEKMIPNIKDINPNKKPKNLISGFLKQYS